MEHGSGPSRAPAPAAGQERFIILQQRSVYDTPGPDESSAALESLSSQVAGCIRCQELAATRTHTVFGTGRPLPRLLLVGEAPGATEDRLGEPFVGEAGQLLDRILEAAGLARSQVYIANVLKCRPPGNRKPLPDEVKNCRPWLESQIAVLCPELILCLGATAAQALLGNVEGMAMMRGGRLFEYRGIPVMCTYHPAYLLRNPAAKREVWLDMIKVMEFLALPAVLTKDARP